MAISPLLSHWALAPVAASPKMRTKIKKRLSDFSFLSRTKVKKRLSGFWFFSFIVRTSRVWRDRGGANAHLCQAHRASFSYGWALNLVWRTNVHTQWARHVANYHGFPPGDGMATTVVRIS